MAYVFLLFLLVLLAAAPLCAHAQMCNSANTNSSSGYNSDCPNGAPYCVDGCYQCSAYMIDDYYCDCPSGQACLRDYTLSSFSKCGVFPKYGQACTTSNDCTTVYSATPQENIHMPCVSGHCRYCDPVADVNVTHVCSSRSSQYPATKICILPGVWGVAGQSTSTTAAASTTTAAATGGGGSTTTSDAR